MQTKIAAMIQNIEKNSAKIAGFIGRLSWAFYGYCLAAAIYRDCCIGLQKFLNTQVCLVGIICSWAFGEFGTVVGTLVGTYYLPGIGTMCGPFVGGTAGSYIGGKIANKIGNNIRARHKSKKP